MSEEGRGQGGSGGEGIRRVGELRGKKTDVTGIVWYLAHWEGGDTDDDTWEQAAGLGSDEWLVSEWEAEQTALQEQTQKMGGEWCETAEEGKNSIGKQSADEASADGSQTVKVEESSEFSAEETDMELERMFQQTEQEEAGGGEEVTEESGGGGRSRVRRRRRVAWIIAVIILPPIQLTTARQPSSQRGEREKTARPSNRQRKREKPI